MIKILDLYAPWCAPCKVMSPILDELSKELGFELEKVNIDDNEEIAEYYSCRSIPMLIFFKDGEQVFKTTGSKTKQQLIDVITKL